MASAMLKHCVQPIKTVEVNNASEPSCVNVISVNCGVEDSKFYVSLMQLTSSSDINIVKIPVECVAEVMKQMAKVSISMYTKSLQDAVIPDVTKLLTFDSSCKELC